MSEYSIISQKSLNNFVKTTAFLKLHTGIISELVTEIHLPFLHRDSWQQGLLKASCSPGNGSILKFCGHFLVIRHTKDAVMRYCAVIKMLCVLSVRIATEH